MSDPFGAQPSLAHEPEAPPRPAFLSRFWAVFVSPGELFARLALNPAWFPMAMATALIGAAAMAILIPTDVFVDSAVREMRNAGSDPDAIAQFQSLPGLVLKGGAVGVTVVAGAVVPVLLAAFTYVAFVFVRGDQGTFKQHLCVVSHAGIVTAVGSIVNFAVSARRGVLDESLSLGSFFPFLPDGYFLSLLSGLSLFWLWAAATTGIGLAQVDPRRAAGPTMAVLVALLVVVAAIMAAF